MELHPALPAGASAALTALARLLPAQALLLCEGERIAWASAGAFLPGDPLPAALRAGPSAPLGALSLRLAPLPAAAADRDEPAVVSFHGVVTRDPAMQAVIELIRNIAETEATVLIRGESGTGKELVAAALHAESKRRHGPFIAVNCGAFPASLLESELFGHVKGAFTGALSARKGIFAQAHGGTLFLDEVAELPLELQPKLLRVLQERVVVPVGGAEPIPVDVRVVAATHRALREEARQGRFRADLLYRLRVVPLFLPALRERPLDIALLIEHFIAQYNERGPRHISTVDPATLRILLAHPWPGNVRELRNVIEYAFAVGRSAVYSPADLPPELRGARPVLPEDGEAARLQAAIAEAGGDLRLAAARLGLSRTTFWRLRRRHGL